MKLLNKFKRKLLLLFLLTLSFSLWAEEIVIREINFVGLKRTKEKTALQIVRPVEIGDLYSKESESIIIQELREAGIFNPEITTEVTFDGQEAIITVNLKDRWTLIPIPIFSFSQNGAWRVGVLGIEGNLLGYNKTLGLGFFYGSEGWSLLSFYSDSIFLGTDMTFSSSVNLGLNETTDENVNEETIRSYQSDEIRLGVSLEYPFTEELSFTTGWAYDRSVLRDESAVATGLDNLNSTGLSGVLKWKDIYYDIPYEYGLLASINYGWNWGLQETENYQKIIGKFKWGLNPAWKHLFLITADTGFSQNLPVQSQFRLGGAPGSLVLPMGRIAAEEYAKASAVYNIPLWYFPGGTLSMKAFYEAGYYKSDLINQTLFHGPGTGIEIFINNLAIPALQFNIAWNLETGRYQFTAGVGMGGGAPD
ncbi:MULTISPECIES: BamA/TamA family outer membrane protein [unclassified Oceanispirochaeta]|uniref:BamA/TamA family outer membrane protein n=1 Tax=unclassified Oceanispirochaeta TaxID=2635722 RepID=UPI0013140F3C|nr:MULTISPECIES: BamA/TamA family outer membrane protein [unclassified Oceanispirochaeta]MBF9015443.1 BamA/TamA family outer membrane protein [Oceanispirochaeta sp. M2]NPD71902.1 BamA/TamA family outer membrane protein [Oceanispirochaeta sp. M1]